MKKAIYTSLLTLLASCVMAQPSKGIEASLDYQQAIAQAVIKQRIDRRPELRRCIKHWDALRVERIGLLFPEPSEGRSGEQRLVLLEIGNSGFPRYDYVRIDGFLLTSSLGPSSDISQSALGEHLTEMYAKPPTNLRGSADAKVDDGNCYYLTVSDSGIQKSVAMYGPPGSTPLGLLIKEMIKVARGVKSP